MSALKPSGSTAVMASTAGLTREGDAPLTALCRKLEYFPTPPWAARAGAELINEIDPPNPAGFGWHAWDPCCGEGHMAAGLAHGFAHVRATDIHDWSGEAGSCSAAGSLQHGPGLDFLSAQAAAFDPVDWIVTNPPFSLAAEVVATGLQRARRGVAVLARVSLLESATRFSLFFGADRRSATSRPDSAGFFAGEQRLAVFAPFIERVPMTLGRWDPKASTATAYAWFVWIKPSVRAGLVPPGLSLRPEVWPIAPGTRARLTMARDARDWGARSDDGGLLGRMGEFSWYEIDGRDGPKVGT